MGSAEAHRRHTSIKVLPCDRRLHSVVAAMTCRQVSRCWEASGYCYFFSRRGWQKISLHMLNAVSWWSLLKDWTKMKTCNADVSHHSCVVTLFLCMIWQIHSNYFYMQSLLLQSSNLKYLLFYLLHASCQVRFYSMCHWNRCPEERKHIDIHCSLVILQE